MARHNGPAIRALREARGMTLLELAELAEGTCLACIEDEAGEATSGALLSVAEALDVPLAAILREPETPLGEEGDGAGQDIADTLADLLAEVRTIRERLAPCDTSPPLAAIDDPDVPDEVPDDEPVPSRIEAVMPFGDDDSATWEFTATGRTYIECDNPSADAATRCGRRTHAIDRLDLPPIGWATAPYPADYDHGQTQRMIDGTERPPAPAHIGLVGDLHTCPRCAAGVRR